MQIILNENQTKENRKISRLELDDKIVYYKEIVHPLEFTELYRNEKLFFNFSAKVTVNTKRPFITLKSKDRNSLGLNEGELVLIRICNGKQEAQLVTKIYNWGKIQIPKDIIEILNIKHHKFITVKIILKNKILENIKNSIDLSKISNYNENVK